MVTGRYLPPAEGWSIGRRLTRLTAVTTKPFGNAHQEWLTPGVAGIGMASFLADVGHEVPTALLPSLLTTTLGAPASALGLIEGISDGLAGVARLGGGAFADDPSRRRAVAVGGYTSTAVLAASTGAATAVWQVGLLRAGAWTARGLRVPARNALLADVVEPTAYGRAYGFERAMDNLGAIGGPLLAIGLVSLVGARWAIALSVIPGLLATLAILYAARHIAVPQDRERPPLRIRIRPVLHGGVGRLFGGIAAFEMANCAATLMILRATELLTPAHHHDHAATLALWLYVLYNVSATVVSIPAGRMADRRSPQAALTLGALAFAIAYLGFTQSITNVTGLVPWFVLAGIGIGFAETAEHAAVASSAAADIRGSAFGLLAAVQSLGNFAASTVAGVIWSTAGPGWAFGYLGVWMVVAVPLIASSSVRRA